MIVPLQYENLANQAAEKFGCPVHFVRLKGRVQVVTTGYRGIVRGYILYGSCPVEDCKHEMHFQTLP